MIYQLISLFLIIKPKLYYKLTEEGNEFYSFQITMLLGCRSGGRILVSGLKGSKVIPLSPNTNCTTQILRSGCRNHFRNTSSSSRMRFAQNTGQVSQVSEPSQLQNYVHKHGVYLKCNILILIHYLLWLHYSFITK